MTANESTRTLQYRGEYQGTAAYETERSCPACGYDVEYCGMERRRVRVLTNCYNQGENVQEGGDSARKEEEGIEITQEILDKISHCIELEVRRCADSGIARHTSHNSQELED